MTDKYELDKLEMTRKQNNYIFDNSILFNKKDLLMNDLEKQNNNSKKIYYNYLSNNNIIPKENQIKDVNIENNLIKFNNTRELRQERQNYNEVDRFVHKYENNVSDLQFPTSTRL